MSFVILTICWKVEEDEASYFQSLEEVFTPLEKHGIRLKQEKSSILLPKVEYIGHQISAGRNSVSHKQNCCHHQCTYSKGPSAVEVMFLGLVNYYRKFIRNLAILLQPLDSLLHVQADTKWVWSKKCTKAFQEAKKKITLAQVFTHYDPTWPIQLALVTCTSPYGVGAVISHRMPNGTGCQM